MKSTQTKIDFASSLIRENSIEHARLKKELKRLLQEFETRRIKKLRSGGGK